jgi:uncharacterized protein (TIGR01777 family)
MRIVVAGSSGLIGTALIDRLAAAGHDVVRLVRGGGGDLESRWDPAAGELDPAVIEGADAVVNLAGARIADHRWTDAYKDELRASRLTSTGLLAATIAKVDRKPGVFLSGSAIGYYGARGDEALDETAHPGDDFLAQLCVEWEAATGPAEAAGVRTAHLRTGIVLSGAGGALKKQLPLFKLGLGGKFGNGRQWSSWISIDDEVGAILHLLTADVRGGVNLTAPAPVRNTEFAKTLGQVLHRPAALPIPSFGPKLVLGGELASSLLFTGQRVVPAKLQESGYRFRHPSLEAALRGVLNRPAA